MGVIKFKFWTSNAGGNEIFTRANGGNKITFFLRVFYNRNNRRKHVSMVVLMGLTTFFPPWMGASQNDQQVFLLLILFSDPHLSWNFFWPFSLAMTFCHPPLRTPEHLQYPTIMIITIKGNIKVWENFYFWILWPNIAISPATIGFCRMALINNTVFSQSTNTVIFFSLPIYGMVLGAIFCKGQLISTVHTCTCLLAWLNRMGFHWPS